MVSVDASAKALKIYMNSGTGFIVSRDGYIITNEHVVKSCKQIRVMGAANNRLARLINTDREYDLALLQIDGSLPDIAVLRDDSQGLAAGEEVVIVGYPGEAAKALRTVTREGKIVNPKGPRGEDKWVEFDDVIAQGNSGGAMLDTSGHVVGVVAAKATIYTYELGNPENGSTRNSGIAVSLPVLKEFLSSNGVEYRQEISDSYLSAHRVTDMAERFMVNVRCEYKTEVQ